ncbi:MAG: ABC transporter permease [Actinomycetota bacterium]|nr:ABC transporter permease [Actinomycetota bacterium]MDD5666156.1 ABC transporter permease [Actinomycetota bacterium]
MLIFILRRLYQTVIVVIGVVLLLSFMMTIIPGDVAQMRAPKGATEEMLQNIREKFHLDKPFFSRFWIYLKGLPTFDLGDSFTYKRPVMDIIREGLPWSIKLAIVAEIIIIILGILAGVISSVSRYSFWDVLVTITTTILVAMPIYWIGRLLQLFFSQWLSWLPAAGAPPPGTAFFTGLKYYIMPAVALAAISTAYVARMQRSSMLEVMRQDYIQTARAKGLSNRRVTYKHGLKNGLIPVVTYIGIDFGVLIGAAVLTEIIFNWPGIGHKVYNAVLQRDHTMVIGTVFVLVLIFVFINLLVDISYAFLDPRIRLGGGQEVT